MRATKLIIVPAEGIGLPDYSAPKPTGAVPVGPIFTSTDIGELAARLGSIVTHDRRGNVIWLDDFEAGFNWTINTGSGTISTHCSKSGASCAKLTVDPTISEFMMIRRIPIPTRTKFGFEYSFVYQYLNLVDVWAEIYFEDRENDYQAMVRWVAATGLCQYSDETGVFQNLAPTVNLQPSQITPPNAPITPTFNVIKLVVDLHTKEYVRLILNDLTYDMTGKSVRLTGPTAGRPGIINTHVVFRSINNAGVMYVANAIVTQNEPENAPVAA